MTDSFRVRDAAREMNLRRIPLLGGSRRKACDCIRHSQTRAAKSPADQSTQHRIQVCELGVPIAHSDRVSASGDTRATALRTWWQIEIGDIYARARVLRHRKRRRNPYAGTFDDTSRARANELSFVNRLGAFGCMGEPGQGFFVRQALAAGIGSEQRIAIAHFAIASLLRVVSDLSALLFVGH